jgi:hypothetical protein
METAHHGRHWRGRDYPRKRTATQAPRQR